MHDVYLETQQSSKNFGETEDCELLVTSQLRYRFSHGDLTWEANKTYLQDVAGDSTTTVFDAICLASVDSANFNFTQLKIVRNLIMRSSSDSHKAHK